MAVSITASSVADIFKPIYLDFVASSVMVSGATDEFIITSSIADSDVIVFIGNQTYVGGSDLNVEFPKGAVYPPFAAGGVELKVLPGMTAAYVVKAGAIEGFDGVIKLKITPVKTNVSLGALGVSVAALELDFQKKKNLR